MDLLLQELGVSNFNSTLIENDKKHYGKSEKTDGSIHTGYLHKNKYHGLGRMETNGGLSIGMFYYIFTFVIFRINLLIFDM
jgi:hypothetical protein